MRRPIQPQAYTHIKHVTKHQRYSPQPSSIAKTDLKQF